MKDHHHTANAFDLDAAYCALARIGQRRGRLDPTVGTLDRALVETLTGLQELRRHLDREAVAAGFSSVCIRRDLCPASATRIAAAEAMQAQREQDLAEQIERERRRAAHGERGWAVRQGVGSSRELPGSSVEPSTTGDENPDASLHEPRNEIAPVPPPSTTNAASICSDDHANAKTAAPLSGTQAAI